MKRMGGSAKGRRAPAREAELAIELWKDERLAPSLDVVVSGIQWRLALRAVELHQRSRHGSLPPGR